MQQAAIRSSESDMTANNAESWARLRLVQGESSTKKWELTPTQGNATLTIGTSSDCTWIVQEEGVRPVHFSLHWDGRTLRIADVYSAGDVRVDGGALSAQWRPLLGRARVEFGKAAMVVETAVGSAQSDAAEAERATDAPRSNAPRNPKGTLIGVVATPTPVPSYLQVPAPSEAPESKPPSAASETKKSAPPGSLKATLVGGIAVTMPSAAPTAGSPKNKQNATLMGFSAAEALRGVVGTPAVPVGGGAPSGVVNELDQRTVQGFPAIGAAPSGPPPSGGPQILGRRLTQKGLISRPPGVLEGAVAHAPVRAVSERPGANLAGERIGSAWQEVPDADAVLAEPVVGAPPAQPAPTPSRPPRTGNSAWEIGERLSELPTQMRDEASFATARRRRRQFPWRYVGVLLLTGVAYFAWLYLLDHW